ncbi:hypothetical protein BRADI_1g32360v3 [Brachypodium distachyon]|uniref:Uncharacterized protein n=1 Tax=Brachypodium distachyon TaxID=15368 RepID=A0A2K2DMD3_BRADI|nr:hypothetical protein BRADI_1g32360v3 [Brachypodium distachyon]
MCRCAAAIARAVLAFFDAVLVDCFLSWFRYGRPVSEGHRDLLVPKDRLGEALSASDEEKGYGEGTSSHEHSADVGDIDKELRLEANYLRLCGTISQTPAELRNVSYEISLENSNECDDISINELAMGGTLVSDPNSCESFIRTQPNNEVPQVDSIPQSVLQEKSPFWSIKNRFSDCTDSPIPTPLVLRDDMQTPGTIYTSHTGSSASRKRLRTRKQFVYPVLRPIENKLQQMELTEDASPVLPSNTPKRINLGADYIKSSVDKEESKCRISSPNLLDGGALSKSNSDESDAALSLCHWLKPSSSDIENQESPVFRAASGMNGDVENPTPRLPKAWDGNGIPNTISKYKEVSWHATPFEERLMKVLSDDKPNPPRKLTRGNLFHVEEMSER